MLVSETLSGAALDGKAVTPVTLMVTVSPKS
jgi:hypothetical protein